ncbi:hypothetical protein DRE_01238 [Drechslerella stenobrocha 248]|uniref:SCP domain-containing protein n=1 Tax=Drechslerella stenobrocha 248 TaxID=1043628 RepID=W7HWF3_9PEZI|nr:hypothetical protein DRE_01238 [Drechslerella stenobrocha 248]
MRVLAATVATLVLAFLSWPAAIAYPQDTGNEGVIAVVPNLALSENTNSTLDGASSPDKRAKTVTTGGTLPGLMLKYHNAWRAHHGTAALKWNAQLATVAQKSASKCVFAHTVNNKNGENIAAGTYTNPAYYAFLWYNEVTKYNYNRPGFTAQTGHFTQVIWKGTKSIGCAWVRGCSGR